MAALTLFEAGWQRPTRLVQATLFPCAVETTLAETSITVAEADDWSRRGWLSFSVSSCTQIDEPEWAELVFVRNLARSGLGSWVIDRLLADLGRPYRLHPHRVAYSFAFGWVELPRSREPDPAKLTSELVSEWVDIAETNDDRDSLLAVAAAIEGALERMEASE